MILTKKMGLLPMVALGTMLLTIAACESVQDKQRSVCLADIKRNLRDPNSLEVILVEPRERDDGTFLLIIDYTAKNGFGGRGRGSASCGFKTKSHTELNPDEFQNQLREIESVFR